MKRGRGGRFLAFSFCISYNLIFFARLVSFLDFFHVKYIVNENWDKIFLM